MLSVLTFDLRRGLSDGNATATMGNGQTIYASADNLYVATATIPAQPWLAPAATQIHKFAISGSGPARHLASGTVPGSFLNQFSMSEYAGHLRVATTLNAPGMQSENLVTVLAERQGQLVTTGVVGGLGLGERIYAVRFQGPLGYVVTFRQTDPLYTLDLSDPARPVAAGELEITGYSAYLHAVGDGLLLGIGQDATPAGFRLGAQMSLFDVSNPAEPQRLAQQTLGNGSSEVERDHHAFLWWPPTRLAVVPTQWWGPPPLAGAVAVAVGHTEQDGLREAGRIVHTGQPGFAPGVSAPITRTLMVGERLYTLSGAGLLVSRPTDFGQLGWLSLT
jgi:hypothetical protein